MIISQGGSRCVSLHIVLYKVLPHPPVLDMPSSSSNQTWPCPNSGTPSLTDGVWNYAGLAHAVRCSKAHPIGRLPVELLTMIFGFSCLKTRLDIRHNPQQRHEGKTIVWTPPEAISAVCRGWRHLILSPTLQSAWASFGFETNGANQEETKVWKMKLLKVFLHRSQHRPLDLDLKLTPSSGTNSLLIVLSLPQHAGRWRSISLDSPLDEWDDVKDSRDLSDFEKILMKAFSQALRSAHSLHSPL
jgi:hypothetical protein